MTRPYARSGQPCPNDVLLDVEGPERHPVADGGKRLPSFLHEPRGDVGEGAARKGIAHVAQHCLGRAAGARAKFKDGSRSAPTPGVAALRLPRCVVAAVVSCAAARSASSSVSVTRTRPVARFERISASTPPMAARIRNAAVMWFAPRRTILDKRKERPSGSLLTTPIKHHRPPNLRPTDLNRLHPPTFRKANARLDGCQDGRSRGVHHLALELMAVQPRQLAGADVTPPPWKPRGCRFFGR